jgi:outer membrane immunogenic protein
MLYHQLRGLFAAGVAATAFCSAPALAADMPVKAPVDKAAPIFDGTGFYVGAQAGDLEGRAKNQTLVAGSVPFWVNPRGAFGGGYLGYNWQSGNWVVGLETDFNGDDARGSFAALPGLTFHSRLDWFGSVRGRVGFAQDRWLAYATGGYAYGQFEHGVDATVIGSARIQDTREGWTLGGGLEYAFWNNLSARIEYRYVDFGKKTYAQVPLGAGFLAPHTVDLTTQLVLVGLSYKFGSR